MRYPLSLVWLSSRSLGSRIESGGERLLPSSDPVKRLDGEPGAPRAVASAAAEAEASEARGASDWPAASTGGWCHSPGPYADSAGERSKKERGSLVRMPLAVRRVVSRRNRTGAGDAASEQLAVREHGAGGVASGRPAAG